jgi:hypothetical protein
VQWVQRVGKVVLDSSQYSSNVTPTLYPSIRHVITNVVAAKSSGNLMSDMFKAFPSSFYGDASGSEVCGIYEGNGSVRFNVKASRLSADSAEGIQTWMDAEKPILYYPLATPVTHNLGYVDNWPIEIAGEATVTCPELEELGVTFWVDGDGLIVASMRKWYERAHSEYEDRLVALESAVAEIIAGA